MHPSTHRPIPFSAAALLAGIASVLLAGCGPNLFDRIGNFGSLTWCGIAVVIIDVIALIELLGSNKTLGAKVLWALIIIFFPVLGCVLYFFVGRS